MCFMCISLFSSTIFGNWIEGSSVRTQVHSARQLYFVIFLLKYPILFEWLGWTKSRGEKEEFHKQILHYV